MVAGSSPSDRASSRHGNRAQTGGTTFRRFLVQEGVWKSSAHRSRVNVNLLPQRRSRGVLDHDELLSNVSP